MKQKIKEFFKPTVAKAILTIFFLTWQYLFVYMGYGLDLLEPVFKYLGGGLSVVSWDNYLMRIASLVFVWILVAVVIFVLIWSFERVSIFIHNRRIEKKYLNQPRENYENLLKSQKIGFRSHFLSYAIWGGGVMIFFVTLFFLAQQIEALRFWALDTMLWNALESGEEINFNEIWPQIISFVALVPLWYIISCAQVWIFVEGKQEEEKGIIEEEHLAVVIEEPKKETDED